MGHVRLAAALLPLVFGSIAMAQPRVASTQPRRVDVSWDAVPGATGYSVMRRGLEAERWARVASLGPEAKRHADVSAAARTTYRYRVDPTGGAAGVESASIEALDEFYLELREAEAGSAKLYVHRWDPGFEEWMRGDLIEVEVGQRIGREGMITDFRTGAKLELAGPDPKNAALKRVRYTTRDGRRIVVTTLDSVPVAVRPKPKKAKKKVTRLTPKRSTASATPGTPRVDDGNKTLAFPEPTRTGNAKGTKVVWEMTNSTSVRMNVLIMSNNGAKRSFKLGPGKEYVARFKRGGTYKVSAAIDESKSEGKIKPLEGSFGLASGSKYTSNLKIEYRDK